LQGGKQPGPRGKQQIQRPRALTCALIVDDEPLARRGVLLRLRKFRDVEIVSECGDGPSAVEKIIQLSPDVVFLDVQMPDMDGFDVLRKLPKVNLPGVIFLTDSEHRSSRTYARQLDYWLSSGKA
jgi:two-component system LytT family response regulator